MVHLQTRSHPSPSVSSWKSRVITVLLLSVLYIAVGYSVTKVPNPLTQDFIAFQMVIIVLSGSIFGPKTGFFTGICGGILGIILALILKPEGVGHLFALYTMLPNALMGYTAGLLTSLAHSFIASLSIILGHALNILFLNTFTSLILINFQDYQFWQSIGYETLIDVIAINMIFTIFSISFSFIRQRW